MGNSCFLFQVDKALEHLKQYHSSVDKDVTFIATVGMFVYLLYDTS